MIDQHQSHTLPAQDIEQPRIHPALIQDLQGLLEAPRQPIQNGSKARQEILVTRKRLFVEIRELQEQRAVPVG